MSTKFDLLVWKYIVPMFRVEMFQWKIVQLLAVGYSLCYSLPRRLMRHYFFGKGTPIQVDGQKLINDNPHLLALIQEQTQCKPKGVLAVSQLELTDPKWKYSVGSFSLYFNRKPGGMELQLRSNYDYQQATMRLTQYLHQALASSVKTKGFSVSSPTFLLSNTALEGQPAWSEIKTAAPFALYLLV
ncbi:hypothetical protein [Sunxiuqinia sp. sy24]|uniref:hypothetical protein n=1 Tax=Sunxiuqinia sp. sy24 TaxID=3461495 RepID=UPI0040461075